MHVIQITLLSYFDFKVKFHIFVPCKYQCTMQGLWLSGACLHDPTCFYQEQSCSSYNYLLWTQTTFNLIDAINDMHVWMGANRAAHCSILFFELECTYYTSWNVPIKIFRCSQMHFIVIQNTHHHSVLSIWGGLLCTSAWSRHPKYAVYTIIKPNGMNSCTEGAGVANLQQ